MGWASAVDGHKKEAGAEHTTSKQNKCTHWRIDHQLYMHPGMWLNHLHPAAPRKLHTGEEIIHGCFDSEHQLE